MATVTFLTFEKQMDSFYAELQKTQSLTRNMQQLLTIHTITPVVSA